MLQSQLYYPILLLSGQTGGYTDGLIFREYHLPVGNVQGYNMHQESLALTSMLFCRTGLPRECYQSPSGDKNKMEGQCCKK